MARYGQEGKKRDSKRDSKSLVDRYAAEKRLQNLICQVNEEN